MSTIQDNIEKLDEALVKVKSHCMCAKFADLGGVYRVIYPPGYKFDGVQASYGIGKLLATERLLEAMEKHWIESGIN